MSTFKDFSLDRSILRAIDELGFHTPTAVQAETIPAILNSKNDLIALAQTGTGKTAGFGLPVLQQIDADNAYVQAIILCPTRELCLQITKDLESYARYLQQINILAVYGGTKYDKQIRELRRGVHVVVGTPGRVLDLIEKNALKINHIKWLVLDEADEMLNMGFRQSLDDILVTTPAEKQTLLFSATMPSEVRRIASSYMRQPQEISVGNKNTGGKDIEHHYYVVKSSDKYLALKRIADMHHDMYGIVFCRTRQETQRTAEQLIEDGYNADVINGDLSQAQRDQVMHRFRTKQINLLVATDVAARGIDVSELTHVINLNLPDDLEVYVHRSGRTGRAGNKGISIILTHSREGRRLRDLEKMVGKSFEHKLVPSGDDVFAQRLLNFAERIDNAPVDESKLKRVLPAVSQKLIHLDREDLLKRLLALELNRFLEYYDTAKDLNVNAGGSNSRLDQNQYGTRQREDRGRSGRDDRFSDVARGESRSSSKVERSGDTSRGDRQSERKEGRSRNMNFSRFYINLGEKNKIKAANLIGLINENMPSPDIEIGKIDILRNFSFFEIDKQYEKVVIDAFKDAAFGQTKIVVEVANAAEAPAYEPKKTKKKSEDRPAGGGGFSRFGRDGSFPKKKHKDSSKERKAKKKLR